MYDRLKLWVDTTAAGFDPAIVRYLEQPREFVDYGTGEIVGNIGNLGNIRVAVFRNGVSINGSVSKYYLGDNIQTLTRRDTIHAIEKLSDSLHLAVSDARPVEIEFGTNFLLSNPIAEYLQRLGDMPRFVKNTFTASTLYYQHKGKNQPSKFVFYDKIADAIEKGVTIPDGLAGANVLRYEMRLFRRIAKQTGFIDLSAGTLTDKRFYRHLLQTWGNRYFSIRKFAQTNNIDMEQIKTVGDAVEVLFAKLLAADPEQTTNFIATLKDAKVFSDPKYYTRVKSKLQAIAAKSGDASTDAILKELDDEVKTAMANN